MGVGTASPNRTLTVQSNGGQMSINDTDNTNGGIFCNAGNFALYARGNSQLGDGSVGGIFSVQTHTAGGSTAERFRIDSSGRMMIGTTTEGESTADDLTIATSGSTGITLRSGTGYAGNILFSDGTSGNDELRGIIQYHHNGDSMRFFTNAAERLRISSAGYVGIGENTPDAPLHISADSGGSQIRLQRSNAASIPMIMEEFTLKAMTMY